MTIRELALIAIESGEWHLDEDFINHRIWLGLHDCTLTNDELKLEIQKVENYLNQELTESYRKIYLFDPQPNRYDEREIEWALEYLAELKVLQTLYDIRMEALEEAIEIILAGNAVNLSKNPSANEDDSGEIFTGGTCGREQTIVESGKGVDK